MMPVLMRCLYTLVKKGVPADHCKWSGTIAGGCGLLAASWANSPGLTAMVQLAEQ